MKNYRKQSEPCPYCKGQGYFQVILGGTEDCPSCGGAGTSSAQTAQPAVVKPRK